MNDDEFELEQGGTLQTEDGGNLKQESKFRLTMIDNRDFYQGNCPTCQQVVQVSGDQIDVAKTSQSPLNLDCGHEVPVPELP